MCARNACVGGRPWYGKREKYIDDAATLPTNFAEGNEGCPTYVGVLMTPGRDCFRVREEELISPDEGVVVDSFISLGLSTADFVVALFLVVPSFPPLSDSVPLFPFFPFTLVSPLVVLILEGS